MKVVLGYGMGRSYAGIVHEGLGNEGVEEKGEFLRCGRHREGRRSSVGGVTRTRW